MNYNPELNRKLELYAGGWLKGRELHDFEQSLKSDADLREEAQFRKSVVDAIREVRQLELKNYIKSTAEVRLASNPWSKVWIITSIVIIGAAVAFYFIDLKNLLPEQKSEAEKKETPVPPPVVVHQKIQDTTTTINTDTVSTAISENKIVSKDYNSESKDEKASGIPDNISEDTDTTAQAELENGEEIIVKRDELLATLSLKVIDKSDGKQQSQENLSSTTIEKLNPEAKLPEPARHQEMFRVELWKSPINFKGYRLIKNRLTLFGVEQNVILRIYKIGDGLFLEYEPNTFSKLYQGDQFNAFVKVRDPEILSQLAQ